MTEQQTIRLKEYLKERSQKDFGALVDLFDLCLDTGDHSLSGFVRSSSNEHARNGGGSKAIELYRRSLLFDAKDNFDCFMRYIEFNRPAQEQFWLPRRKKLLPVATALQDMEDGNLDELFLSMPPRVGKTTLMVMFLLWTMGRDTERSNLYCSFTNAVVDTFYNGLMEILKDQVTYSYFDVFQDATIASTNAKDDIINLKRKKRYASFTGRPIDGTLNGSCDCNGYLIGDDLCSGIEEAKSKERMKTLWTKVDNNLIPRAKQNAKRLWIGTRWSLIDPQGIRIDLLENDQKYKSVRWKYINTPALNETDESNFDYMYGVGYSTDFYQQRRASFERNSDMASWMAQYQGEPIERDGTVFDPESLRYYNGVLPDEIPDRIIMAVDPAWGGGDYVSAPVGYMYGDDIYIPDLVFNNGEKNITQPMVANAIQRNNVAAVKVEGTKMTASYGEDIDKILRDRGIRVNMNINTSHFTGTGKRQRIFDKAPEIRERFVFLAEGHRPKEYTQFMQNLFSFTVTGKAAKNDDSADSCAMLVDFATAGMAKAVVFSRPF